MKKFIANSHSIGKFMLLISLLIVVPIMIIPFYPEEIKYIPSFLIAGLISVTLAVMTCKISQLKPKNKEKPFENCYVTVVFVWLYGCFISALPFFFSGQLLFVQSLFEAVSGWTTTGLSVMDVSNTPMIFLFHRSFMQFCGGLGFVMMLVMIVQEKESMSLFYAEGHQDKLTPNLRKTAQTVLFMYVTYLLIGSIAYVFCGMNLFDAITHTMCALSTGGFSTKVESIAAYQSVAIEAVTIVLMLIGTTNFAVLLLLSKRKYKQLVKVSEVKFMVALICICSSLVAGSLFFQMYLNLGESIRHSVFNVISAISTTGFSTMSYDQWPVLGIGIMIILMFIGGGIGSTAGGMKLSRAYLVYRMVKENFNRKIKSSRKISNPFYYTAQGKQYLNYSVESETVGFVFLYVVIFIVGSLALTVTAQCSLSDAMFEFASSLGTVGLSIGLTGPDTNAPTLFVEMVGMILGRLEIYIVIIGINVWIKNMMRHSYQFLKQVTKVY